MTHDSPFKFGLRAVAVAAVVVAGVLVSDGIWLFQAPLNNNPHVEKRWEALRKLHHDSIPLDVLIVGNSHSYTGINPKHLSAELGANAFVLANNGTNWADSEWMIREALNYCSPKVIVLETYGCDHSEPGMEGKTHFVDQVRAYRARNEGRIHWESAWDLFSYDELPAALSPTLLNHHYTWTDPERVKSNFRRKRAIDGPDLEGLFLGRFVRFTTGLTDSLLTKYVDDGAPVDGNELTMSEANLTAGEAIAELCTERGIELVLLSLPMYKEHVAHMAEWTSRREVAWTERMPGVEHLNFQELSDLADEPAYFENTYGGNQHMTLTGSIAATGYLAQNLMQRYDSILPSRDETAAWHELFEGEEGYYAFQTPQNGDATASTWARQATFESYQIQDILSFPTNKDKVVAIQLRMAQPDAGEPAPPKQLRTQWLFRVNGDSAVQRALIPLEIAPHLTRDDVVRYRHFIKPDITLLKLEGVGR